MTSDERAFPVFGMVYNIFAIPYNFFIGFIVGLAAPVAAIAAIVFGVRYLTGKMPFLSLRQEDEDERRLSIELVAPEAARELYAAEKEKIMGDLGSLGEEIQSMIDEAKAAAEEGTAETEDEATEAS
jgi:hypothetical protein